MDEPSRQRVVLLDPGTYTPYYTRDLALSLAGLGLAVEVIGSVSLFESLPEAAGYTFTPLFFRIFERGWARTGPLRRNRRLRMAVKAVSYPAGLLRTWLALRGGPAGVLHVQWALVPVLDRLLLVRLRRRGWRIVYTAHDLPAARGRRGYERLCRASDLVLVHSQGLLERLAGEFDVPRERIRVVPMGVVGAFLGPVPPRAEARRELGLPNGAPVVLFFGWLKRYKGLEALLEALAHVRETLPEVVLVIAGEPTEGVDRIAPAIERLGLNGSVVFRPGYVPWTEAGRYFRAADLVAVPYTAVSMSAVVLTSFAYGRPVVATAVGGVPDVVREGETGFLARAADPVLLADALRTALADPARLERMGEAARTVAEREHAWPAVAETTKELYRTVTSRSAA